MVCIAEGTSEVRKKVRGKYWDEFLEDISFMKNLTGVWNEVNKVRGIKRRNVAHPNPKMKAKELIRKWASASSFANLPENVKTSLLNKSEMRRNLVRIQMQMGDETCLPFTRDE